MMRALFLRCGSFLGCLACLLVRLGCECLPQHRGSSGVSAFRFVVAKSAAKPLCVGLVLEQGCEMPSCASAA